MRISLYIWTIREIFSADSFYHLSLYQGLIGVKYAFQFHIFCISSIYLPFSDKLFRISINFKQVQDFRDAALDKSNSIDAGTCNRPSEPGFGIQNLDFP